ncbi:MAG: hypothetical protein WBP81_09040 [Solirubrobacteraceae bacterium]
MNTTLSSFVSAVAFATVLSAYAASRNPSTTLADDTIRIQEDHIGEQQLRTRRLRLRSREPNIAITPG